MAAGVVLMADEARIQALSYQSKSKDESSGQVTDDWHPSRRHRFPGVKDGGLVSGGVSISTAAHVRSSHPDCSQGLIGRDKADPS